MAICLAASLELPLERTKEGLLTLRLFKGGFERVEEKENSVKKPSISNLSSTSKFITLQIGIFFKDLRLLNDINILNIK